MDLPANQRGSQRFARNVAAAVVLAISLFMAASQADAHSLAIAPLCGDGIAPDYGFSYNRQQEHWTVGWNGYTSVEAVTGVDVVLDELNADSIAQTMVLILPQAEVGNQVNCAVHFLRYMKLGEPNGERKDNGFVFLIVVGAARIDVHYGVGLGLPALTAPELTAINRATEATFEETQSLDQALLGLARDFDRVARSDYAPLVESAPTQLTSGEPPLSLDPMSILTVCGGLCLGVFFLLALTWAISRLGRRGIRFNPTGFGSWGGGFSGGGGRGNSPMRGGGRSSPPMRGGGGSGRSGRGN
ncbi:MAG: hypothetical protein JNL73_24455 [Anaerolineales bacterium]|nr:hypothetical protein [Anaerolineales bacterium]